MPLEIFAVGKHYFKNVAQSSRCCKLPCTVELPFYQANEKNSKKSLNLHQLTAWSLLDLLINLIISKVDAYLMAGLFTSIPSSIFTSETCYCYYTQFFSDETITRKNWSYTNPGDQLLFTSPLPKESR